MDAAGRGTWGQGFTAATTTGRAGNVARERARDDLAVPLGPLLPRLDRRSARHVDLHTALLDDPRHERGAPRGTGRLREVQAGGGER